MSFLLKEDGDRILLETGDGVLLDEPPVSTGDITTPKTQIAGTGAVETSGSGAIVTPKTQIAGSLDVVNPSEHWLSQVVAEVAGVGAPGSAVSQVVAEVAVSLGVAPERLSQVVVEVATLRETEAVFVDGEDLIGIHWLHHYDAIGTHRVWSKLDLPDPATYYGGFKEARILSWGEIKRALSDYRGQYEGSSFTWKQSDTDQLIRGLMATHATRVQTGREVIMRSIPDSDRRLLRKPRTVVRGITRSCKPISPLHFEFTAQDYFSAQFQSGAADRQIPRRVITRTDFPNCPNDSIDKPVPVIYGALSDLSSPTAPPTITGDPTKGFYTIDTTEHVYPHAAIGALTSSAAIPSNVIVGTAAGGTLSADVPNGEWGIMVTAVDSLGRETNSAPWYAAGPDVGRGSFPAVVPTASPDGTEKITVSWDAAASAVKYRIYLGWYYYGPRWQQWIEVDAPTLSCEFTAGEAWAVPTDSTNITPGANLVQWSQVWYYAVSAMMADGETGRSVEIFAWSAPYRRPVTIQWNAVAGATGYRVYRRGAAAGAYDRRWDVTAPTVTFDDDLLDTGATFITGAPAAEGIVPVTYVGTTADVDGFPWHTFLVCGHAIKSIDGWYLGGVLVDTGVAGVTWAIPGQAGFATYFPNTGATQYRDINGRRYTLIYLRGPDADAALDGTKPITLNVKGIESVGDSSGTLITSLPIQYRHALQNWIIGDYQSGAWLTSPAMSDDPTLKQIDDYSFDRVHAIFASRLAGGYVGAFMLGAQDERISIRDTLARFHLCGMDGGFNRRTQFFVTTTSDAASLITNARRFTQATEIIAGSFNSDDRDAEWFNTIPYDYARNYRGSSGGSTVDGDGRHSEGRGEWLFSDEDDDPTLIADYGGEVRTSERVALHMVRLPSVAASIIGIRKMLSAEPPRWVTFAVGLSGLSVELGDIVLVTHLDGATVWIDNPIRIVRHSFNPDTYKVTFEGYDANRIFGTEV